jgi:hypothetical protein
VPKGEKRKIVADLLVVLIVTTIALIPIMIFGQKKVIGVVNGSPLLVKIIFMALIQFAIAGLGVVIVMLKDKEKFNQFGLKKDGILKSMAFGAVLTLIFITYTYIKEGSIYYMPFRQVHYWNDLINSNFPVNIIGMMVVALAWGFFECFNYVYISRKINRLINIKNPFLRLGPIVMGISCIFVHGAVGQDMLTIAGSLFIVYLTLLIPELTGNSWGSVLIFMLFWNAV